MTNKRSPPESNPTSPMGDGRDAESAATPESMTRFKKLAKKVVGVSREEVAAEEKRLRDSKSD